MFLPLLLLKTNSVSIMELCLHLNMFFDHNELPAVFTEVFLLLTGPVDHPLLPCLPPASAMQVDVNRDAKRPPGRTRAQDHARSYPSHLPGCTVYPANKLVFIWKSNVLWPNDHLISVTNSSARLQTAVYSPGNFLLFTKSSKVSAATSSTLLCVSIETTTGKAGSRLMASQLACDAQLEPIVVKRLSFSV